MVSKDYIAHIHLLPQEGEIWFKQHQVKVVDYNQFLTEQHQNPEWKRYIPRSLLEKEWVEILDLV